MLRRLLLFRASYNPPNYIPTEEVAETERERKAPSGFEPLYEALQASA